MYIAQQDHFSPRSAPFPARRPLCGNKPLDDPIMELNRTIDALSVPWGINEAAIEAILCQWEDHRRKDLPQYPLLGARILEMAILCAGHYVDHCEFTAAGDLLFTPRKILIYLKGFSHPLVKHRHGRLSDQLRHLRRPEDRPFPIWFRQTVTTHIVEPAILPYLLQRLEQSGLMSEHYLRKARQRLEKAADAIAFLNAWSISSFEELRSRINSASCETLRLLSHHLCMFGRHRLDALGKEIRRSCSEPYRQSRFIAPCMHKGGDYVNSKTATHHPDCHSDPGDDRHSRSCL